MTSNLQHSAVPQPGLHHQPGRSAHVPQGADELDTASRTTDAVLGGGSVEMVSHEASIDRWLAMKLALTDG